MPKGSASVEVPRVEKRLRRAGVLIGLGLVVQLVTLGHVHPLAFVAFIAIGCPLVVAGILVYLHSIVSAAEPPRQAD